MDRLRELEVFVAVADAGSFAKAGRRMRLSPPAVTRTIAALESRLGARVFQRTTRSLALTEVGRRFLERARRVLGDLEAAQKEAAGESTTAQGHLTVTASVTLGRSAVAPIVCAFLERHPRVSVSLLLLDRITNLVEEGIDVAVRIGALPDSTSIARRVGSVRRILVAHPDYLAEHGKPTEPSDLRRHSIIAFTGLMPDREWRYFSGGRNHGIALTPRFEINDGPAAIAAAERGDGITLALSYMVAESLRKKRLVSVLDEYALPAVPVHLVHPENRLIQPKLRAFVDFAAPRLKDALGKLSVRGKGAPTTSDESD